MTPAFVTINGNSQQTRTSDFELKSGPARDVTNLTPLSLRRT